MTPQQVSTTNKRITYFLGVNVRLQSDDFRMISIFKCSGKFYSGRGFIVPMYITMQQENDDT